MRIGILTGGGDAPGLNAAIRAIVRQSLLTGDTVIGLPNGWAGAMGEGTPIEIGRHEVFGILRVGGTILGSSRTNPVKIEGGLDRCRATMQANGLDALVAIGGDDTLSVAAKLADTGAPTVGVPKTMDNDLSVTEYCIGFDSAVAVVTEAVDRLHTTAASHHRVMVVEVMGRDTGWVALAGGLAGGADAIIIPEFEVTMEALVDHLQARRMAGSDFSIVCVSEGARIPDLDQGVTEGADAPRDAFGHIQLARRGIGERLAALIEERTGLETRATVLGHTQRGGTPTAFDRIWATRVGAEAHTMVRNRRWGEMPVVRCGGVEAALIADVVAVQRRVPEELYRLASIFA